MMILTIQKIIMRREEVCIMNEEKKETYSLRSWGDEVGEMDEN